MIQKDVWSTLVVKGFDDDARTFEGMASTPSTDRQGDIVDPMGAVFKLPIAMKWQHGKDLRIGDSQIGEITHATPTQDGIRVRGRFWKFNEPASLKDDADRIWALVKAGMRGLSIGFSPLEADHLKGGGRHYRKWQFLELSPVTIAANADASITSIKSFDLAARASSGTIARKSPDVSGTTSKTQQRGNTMRSIPEQIAALDTDRARTTARIDALKTKCDGDPDELDVAEQDELDSLGSELTTFDSKLKRLHTMQGSISKALPVYAGGDYTSASRVRHGDAVMKPTLPPGTMFARAVHAKVFGVKNMMTMRDVASYAAKMFPDTPAVGAYLLEKANPGTGASGNWAEPLSVVNTVEGEFLAELRPATIVGRLGLRPAPFNTRMIVQGPASSAANWVGNAAAKPVGEGVYDTVEIGMSKIAEIIVLTDDQILSSAIDSVEATRQDLIARVSQFADEQFTDPSVVATANNPASVLAGVTPVASGGTTAEDLQHDIYALINKFNAAGIPLTNVTLIMSSFVAWGVAGLRNAFNVPIFPAVSISGGNIDGMRVIVSNNVGGDSSGSNIIAVIPSLILLAQNGGIKVDMSREATIDMAGGNSPTYSLYQKNSVGLRCEWFVSWKKAHEQAAQYISGAAYAPAAPA